MCSEKEIWNFSSVDLPGSVWCPSGGAKVFFEGPSDVADWGLLPVGGVYVYVPIQFVGGDGRGHILAQGPQLKISSFGKEKEELKK